MAWHGMAWQRIYITKRLCIEPDYPWLSRYRAEPSIETIAGGDPFRFSVVEKTVMDSCSEFETEVLHTQLLETFSDQLEPMVSSTTNCGPRVRLIIGKSCNKNCSLDELASRVCIV